MNMARDAKQTVLLDSLRKLLRRGASAHLVNLLQKARPADVAAMWQDLADQERVSLVATLAEKAPELGSRILGEVHPMQVAELLAGLPHEASARLIQELEPDDAAQLVSALPPERAAKVLSLMHGEEAEDVKELLVYPEESAGRIMNPEYFSLHEESGVG